MDNEKNTLDEIKEQAEDAAENAAEALDNAAESANDAVENFEEAAKSAAEDVTEFAEEAYEDVSKQVDEITSEAKPMSAGKIIAVSSVIATIASIVIMLLGSLCFNFVSGIVTANQIKGTWSYNLGSYYGDTVIYVMLDGNKMTLASSDGNEYFSSDYKMNGKNTLKLSTDEETKEKLNGLISGNSLDVNYDKASDSITFNPSIGGISTWNAVKDEKEIADLKEAMEKYKKDAENKKDEADNAAANDTEKTAEDNAEEAPSDEAPAEKAE